MIEAIIRATNADNLPTFTVSDSEEFFLINCLYISIVNIVAVELSIEAKEDTIAAANAATANPLRPVGRNCINHG